MNQQAKILIAGPGTGKTTALLNEIATFLGETSETNDGFIACTFTRKAAEELLVRLYSNVDKKSMANREAAIGTIHSICLELLKLHPSGRYSNHSILSEEQVAPYIFTRLHRLGFDKRKIDRVWDFCADLGAIYSLISDQQIDLESIDYGTRDDLWQIAESYQTFLDLLRKDSYFDFALVQVELLSLLRKDTAYKKLISETFGRIFVDEFQDANPIQNEIFLELAKPNYAITVVGDDDQSIYAFRGANSQNIINFQKYMQEHDVTVESKELILNYRSTPEIVNLSNEYIRLSPSPRLEKVTQSTIKTNSVQPFTRVFDSVEDESSAISDAINRLKNTNKISSLGEIAILFRSVKFQSRHIQKALIQNEIPYIIMGSGDFFDAPFMREFMAILSFILSSDLDSDAAFLNELSLINNAVSEFYSSQSFLVDLILVKDKAQNFKSCISIFYEICIATDFLERHFAEGRNLGTLSKLVLDFDENSVGYDLYGLWSYLSYVRRSKLVDYLQEGKTDAVQIMTFHKAKGLEFHSVFMPMQIDASHKESIVQDFLALTRQVDYATAEEHRLGYVGMTRAKKFLWISYPMFENARKNYLPSEVFRTLQELDQFTSNTLELESVFPSPIQDEEKVGNKKHELVLSNNTLQAFDFCPKYYMYRNVWRLETIRTGGMQFGTNMHKLVQEVNSLIKSGIRTGDLDLEAIVDEHYISSPGHSNQSDNKFKITALNQLASYISRFDINFPGFEIVSIEERFDLVIDGTFLTGRFDLVANIDGKLTIVDFKTGEEGDYTDQVSLYDVCYEEKHSKKPDQVGIYYFNSAQLKIVKTRQKSNVLEKVKITRDKIIGSQFAPTPGPQCSNCSYRNICKDSI